MGLSNRIHNAPSSILRMNAIDGSAPIEHTQLPSMVLPDGNLSTALGARPHPALPNVGIEAVLHSLLFPLGPR